MRIAALSKRFTSSSILSAFVPLFISALAGTVSACEGGSEGSVPAIRDSAAKNTCGVVSESGTGRLPLDGQKTEVVSGLPLGLALVDGSGATLKPATRVDCDKDIVIFVHGWSQGGTPTIFNHSDLWQQRGFQTLVFRWHDLSGGDFEPVFVSHSRVAVSRLEMQLRELYRRLGGRAFKHEIRLVGHSFGAKVAMEVTSRLGSLFPSNGPESDAVASELGNLVPVSRLTLLDPAVFADWTSSEWSLCPVLRLGMDQSARVAGNDDWLVADSVSEEANRTLAVMSMLPAATKVEVYATNVASAFSYSLANRFHVQTLTRSTAFGCFIRFEGLNLLQVHNSVVPGYFSSIAEPAPRLAGDAKTPSTELLSASVPTIQMTKKPGWYVLKEGDPQKNWGRQVFQKNNIPSEYLRIELGNKCVDRVAGRDECSIGIKFVKNF